MDRLAFWKQKIIQFFHDPPAKPYTWFPHTGGHKKVARDLFGYFAQRTEDGRMRGYAPFPDWAASGADRPLLYNALAKAAVPVHWHTRPYITHPLAAGYRLDVRRPGEDTPKAQSQIKDILLEDEAEVAGELGDVLTDWQDDEQLKNAFVKLWRRFREELVSRSGIADRGDPLWEEMPADSRCPDHSIWDHLRVTTALAFMNRENLTDSRKPWLFRFSLGPAQRFIAESRTGRDLWTSSFLLSDLVWHAMLPVVEHYGPDCIIYPDLRANPRADCWLFDRYKDALPRNAANPATFAAVLPNAFVAVLPFGGQGHLAGIEELAQKARQGVADRWDELARTVRDWLKDKIAGNGWREIWDRQHRDVLYTTWSAVAWKRLEPVKDPENLRGRALPAQRPDFREPSRNAGGAVEQDKKNIALRRDRLAPWVPPDTWWRYEAAREVFALTNLGYHQMERGFDYALTHHQLGVRHALRRQTASDASHLNEFGEKCTLCGRRQALAGDASDGHLDISRRAVKEFWKNKELDPEKRGEERLCAVCAMKRFLVDAGNDPRNKTLSSFNRTWAGMAASFSEVADPDGHVRVPFPSTAALAAQKFLADIVADNGLGECLGQVVGACRDADLSRTSFPRALPGLAHAQQAASETGRRFLQYDPQMTLFPEAVEGSQSGYEKESPEFGALGALREAVQKLGREARRNGHGTPGTHFAVVMLDGDHMGRLLLGEEERVGACWRDVIHPKAVTLMLENKHLLAAGWADLLDAKRLMGPSLHAFVSRALSVFSHHVAPWVVEREFSGRLIYAGGDDVLCLAPAGEALAIAARLQQLFSSAWIIDTRYSEEAWAWRSENWTGKHKPDKARTRFAIPARPGAEGAVTLPVTDPGRLAPHTADPGGVQTVPADGRIFPMLGPAGSLSAAVVYAHYKTPMSRMLNQARRLLDEWAKEKASRGAVGLSHFSRNGLKTEFAMKWRAPNREAPAHQRFQHVCQAFAKGRLPNRLPYKLREMSAAIGGAFAKIDETGHGGRQTPDEARETLLRGMFQKALAAPRLSAEAANALDLWLDGMRLFDHEPERAVEGLLLARNLARFSGGESWD